VRATAPPVRYAQAKEPAVDLPHGSMYSHVKDER
jgi:hypothetical protein